MSFDDVAPFGVRLLLGIVAASLTWGAAAVAGWRLCSLIMPKTSETPRLAFGLALGYALTGSIVGILALSHVAYSGIVACVPGLLLVANARTMYAAVRNTPVALGRAFDSFRSADWGDRASIIACVTAALTACIAGALPAVWWDPIAYHLPIAAAALARGTFAFDPMLTQSGFPLLGEAAALPAYALAGSSGAALATLGAGCALAAVCGVIARRFAPGAGWLAAALVMTCPLWLWLAPSFYVDIPFALFAVASIGIGVIAIIESRALDSQSSLLAGTFAGAAAAVKYPGLEVAIISAAFVAFAAGAKGAPRALSIFALSAIAMAGGWYIRTTALTHDPVYPFLTGRLSADSVTATFADRYVSMTMQWCGGSGTVLDAIALPWRMLTGDSAQMYCGDVGYALRLGIVFFVVALVLARRLWPAIAGALALTIAWFEGSRQDRFVVPALCMYAVIVATGVAAAPPRLRRTGALVLVAVGLVAVIAQWTPSFIGLASNSVVPAYAYMSGGESGDDYLARRLEFYSADEWMRAHVRTGTRVLALDDVRDYYAPAVWGNPYYEPVIAVDWTQPPSSRYRSLNALGFSYVVVNANKYYVDRTPTGIDWQVLNSDVKTGWLKAVYSANDVTVYRVEGGR